MTDVAAIATTAGLLYLGAQSFVPALADRVLETLAIVLPVLPAVYAFSGFYRMTFVHPAREMQHMCMVTGTVGASAALSLYIGTGSPTGASLFLVGSVLAAVLVPTYRVFARILLSRTDWWGIPTIILAAGTSGNDVIDTLKRWPEVGLKPVALLQDEQFMDSDGDGAPSFVRKGVPVMGSVHNAPAVAARFHVPCAIAALPRMSHQEQSKVLARYSKFFDHIYVVPELSGLPTFWTASQSSDGLFGYGVRHFALRRGARIAKRLMDIIGGVIALLFATPIIAATALLIKLDSSGSVFYFQHRMGREGRIFKVLKFRTMFLDADKKLQEILRDDPKLRREYEQFHKLQNDPRVTRVGRVLRRYSLDELPQLWNVLRGDMSLVGPRAYMPGELPKMRGLARAVLQTPPGITGLWQVSGRNELSFDARVDLDVHYIQNWSPWLDLYVLVRTIPVVLTGHGAC